MQLVLSHLPNSFERQGIYPEPTGSQLPARILLLHPEAAAGLVQLERDYPGRVFFSDVFRTALSSLRAKREGRGAQPPGYSHHNYGGSVDVAVDKTLKAAGWTYSQMLGVMAEHGWFCHRRDRRRGFEDWHFNWLGRFPEKHLALASDSWLKRGTWARPAESRMEELYGDAFALGAREAQRCLMAYGYAGELDGLNGPLTREAMRAFQRALDLPETGYLDARSSRTLAYVSAAIEYADNGSRRMGA